MQDINEYIDSFTGATRAERLSMALVALLMDIKEQTRPVRPVDIIIEPKASEAIIEASPKPKKSTKKKEVK